MIGNISPKLMVNAVGAIAALIVVAWVISSAFTTEEATVCEGRYPVSTRLSLMSESGEPATLSELQARFGASEWGLLNNAQVVKVGNGSNHPALAVTLGKGTGSGYNVEQSRGGIGLIWRPTELREDQPKAACLSYRLYLPKDLQFSSSGTLPGLMIGSNFDPRDSSTVGSGAVARVGWNREGLIFVSLQYATSEGWKNPLAFAAKKPWPLGRWITVEQEVILNDIGKKNGIIRLWADGVLIGETQKAGLRADAGLAMSGVAADVNYGNVKSLAEAPVETEIRLSSFVVRWQ